MVILAQRCHVNLLFFPALLAFPSRCETWRSSLWMRMVHWVGRVSSWGFVFHSPIKCKVGRLLMRGEEVTTRGQSCVLQSPGSSWREWAFRLFTGVQHASREKSCSCYHWWLNEYQQGKTAQCQIWTHCLGDEINLNFGGGYQISFTSEPRNSLFPKELWVEKLTAGILSSYKHDASLPLLYRGVVRS